MKKSQGISLIELIIFIVIMGILAGAILFPGISVFKSVGTVHGLNVAAQSATRCMEWYLGRRHISGFANISCPSSIVPAICTVPSGYTIAVEVSCGNSTGDLNYKIVNVSVDNNNITPVGLSLQIANY